MTFAATLLDRRFNGYLRYRIPHELDDVVLRVVDTYRAAPREQRPALLSELGTDASDVLSIYGERMAAVAVRTRSEEPLRRGLVAMGMAEAGRLSDRRTNLIVLTAVHHSAATIGSDLGKLITDVAGELPAVAVTTFRTFATTENRSRSLASMGLATEGEGDEFRYTWG